MLVFAAKSSNIPQICCSCQSASYFSCEKHPFLDLSEDSTVKAVNSAMNAPEYATESDDTAALSSVTLISLVGDLSNKAVADRIVEASPSLTECERTMAILQFHQSNDESSDEPVVLEIFPQSNRELLVIHQYLRPVSVRMALQLTPIGLQVIYKLVEVLRGWRQSLPRGLNCFNVIQRNRNDEFLERLIIDVQRVTDNFTTKLIDEAMSEDLQLPERLVHALLLMNVTPSYERQRDECLICGLPVEDARRARLLPTDLELRATSSSCGYWGLMGISLSPGFLDGVFKLCPDHEYSLSRVFRDLMVRTYYNAKPRSLIGE